MKYVLIVPAPLTEERLKENAILIQKEDMYLCIVRSLFEANHVPNWNEGIIRFSDEIVEDLPDIALWWGEETWYYIDIIYTDGRPPVRIAYYAIFPSVSAAHVWEKHHRPE